MEDVLLPFVPITLFMCAAAVAILRPLSKRLGNILEMQYREKVARQAEDNDQAQLKMLLVSMDKRLELMEQRLEFTESLIESQQRKEISDYR